MLLCLERAVRNLFSQLIFKKKKSSDLDWSWLIFTDFHLFLFGLFPIDRKKKGNKRQRRKERRLDLRGRGQVGWPNWLTLIRLNWTNSLDLGSIWARWTLLVLGLLGLSCLPKHHLTQSPHLGSFGGARCLPSPKHLGECLNSFCNAGKGTSEKILI